MRLGPVTFSPFYSIAVCLTDQKKNGIISQLIYMPSRWKDVFVLPSRRSNGSLTMQMWLGSSRAVTAESIYFCKAFAVWCMCQYRPTLTFLDGRNSLQCIFCCTWISAREAHLGTISSASKNWELTAAIWGRRVTIWCSLIFHITRGWGTLLWHGSVRLWPVTVVCPHIGPSCLADIKQPLTHRDT